MDFIRPTRLAVAGLAALTLTANGAQALVIDDFTEGATTLSHAEWSLKVVDQEGLDPNHVLGGSRRIGLGVGTPSEAELGTRATIDDTDGGSFHLQTDPEQTGSLHLSWGSTEDPLDIDLTAHGDRFVFSNAWNTDETYVPPPVRIFLFLRFYNSNDNLTGTHVDLPLMHADQPYDLEVLFGDLPIGDNRLDRVAEIEVRMLGLREGIELGFDSIRVIPEPGSLALLGLGGLAMLWRRRIATT